MNFRLSLKSWRLYFIIGCIGYAVWMVSLGNNDFGRIHREYRLAGIALKHDHIKRSAISELTKECWRQLPIEAEQEPDPCLVVPEDILKKREEKLTRQRSHERQQAFKKLAFFYTFFIIIFILIPPGIAYYGIVAITSFFSSVKFHK